MTEFILCCDDDSLALIIKLRTTCPPKYLQHVQYADINKRAFLCVIYLRALWRVITKKNHTIRINRLKMLVQFQLHMALDRVKRVFLLHRSIATCSYSHLHAFFITRVRVMNGNRACYKRV